MLQVLTSDLDACPAQILAWLKSRWREENFLKYASENYGIDKICDYIAGIETSTKVIDNPARKKASAAVHEAEKAVAAAERDLALLLADPAISPAAKNSRLIPAAQKEIAAAHTKLAAAAAACDKVPRQAARQCHRPRGPGRAAAHLPPRPADGAATARAQRRALAVNHLNAYLCDDDEYRAITRQTIIRGLAGTITYTPQAITVELHRPGAPRVARSLALLIDEINATPPIMPGDTRPITYQLTAHQPGSNK